MLQVTGDSQVVRLGRFEVLLGQRELRADGVPVHLGSRAFDILALLVRSRGTLVAKQQILSAVWPGVVVEESNLQVQVAALRKALAEHRDAIRTIPGRGYQFVAAFGDDVEALQQASDRNAIPPSPPTNLPAPASDLIGRDTEIAEIADRVSARRLVTLTGPGGIGKTRLALEIARRLLPRFGDGAWVVDLATLSDPELVPGAVAAALGLELTVGATAPERIARALAGKRLLLVLDNCEHLIGAAAALAEALLSVDAGAHVLATSREPLLVDGEAVGRVEALSLPAEDITDPAEILRHGSVQLFLARARAVDETFAIEPGMAAAVATVCRRLDGIPLAIELAAARVAPLGVEALARRLDDRFQLLTSGWRTALPRHQTLRATLDWSYDSLASVERRVLCRLAIFPGSFELDAASTIAADGSIAASQVVECVGNLVLKSLLAVDVRARAARHRLLETTRAYALEKLEQSGERHAVARRHAAYFCDLLARADIDGEERPPDEWLPPYRSLIADVRAALDWAFADGGDTAIGVDLLLAAVPLWLHLSLMDECRRRTWRALEALGPAASEPTRRNMQLHTARAQSLMFTKGAAAETGDALAVALAMADAMADDDYRMRALWGLWVHRLNNGAIAESLELARRFCDLAAGSDDPTNRPIGDRMLGFSLHFHGDQAGARAHLERMLATRPARGPSQLIRFQFDPWVTARITLAETLWLLGLPDQAMRQAESGVDEAVALDHAITLGNSLAKAIPVALYVGDLAAAGHLIGMLLDHATRHALGFWQREGRCLEAVLRIKQGDLAGGLAMLRDVVDGQSSTRFILRYTAFLGELADALGRAGAVAHGRAAIDAALARAESSQELWCLAELLRIKGELVRREGLPAAAPAAEAALQRSLALARAQGALAWELRTATTLAELWRDLDRRAPARDLLGAAYRRFAEGLATTDLVRARAVLDTLQ